MSPRLAIEMRGAQEGGGWKRYPAYRDSGVEWLGAVPRDWSLNRARYLFREIDSRTETGDEVLFSLSKTKGLLPRSELTDKVARADTLAGYKIFASGDIVMNKMQAWNGLFGIADQGGIVSPDYAVYRQNQLELDARYFVYLFTTSLYVGQFRWRSRGMGTAFLRLHTSEFNDVVALTPSFSEQHAIAAFLDRETGRIDALVAKKERQIELLQEKRAALISHAVTKGLDPDALMKDSGVEWLGAVPEHWTKMRIKHLLHQIIDTEHKTAPYSPDGNYLVVRTANVRNGILSFDDAKYTDSEGFKEWTRRGVPKPGDILFTREAPAGEACIVPDNVPLCIGQRMVLFRVNKQRLDARFGIYSIYGGLADEFIRSLSQGSTVEHFNMSDIGNTPLFEPSLSEQHTIAAFLDHDAGHIDILATKVYESISKLREYRTALISAAVTGKIDVRGEET